MNKIYGIGLSKTGTLSLKCALEYLGFNIIHFPRNQHELFRSICHYHGACDIPVVAYYKSLDKQFPGSKFIFTYRNKTDWLFSMEKHFELANNIFLNPWRKKIRSMVYGQIDFNKDIFSKKFDEHYCDVMNYFRDRPQDLLILNVEDTDTVKWTKLKTFLQISKEIKIDYPHTHKRNNV